MRIFALGVLEKPPGTEPSCETYWGSGLLQWLRPVPPEQCHISDIGLPDNIEDIPHNGYGADHRSMATLPSMRRRALTGRPRRAACKMT